MRTLFISLLLVAVALAGCAESAPSPVDDDETKFDEIQVDDDKGAIRGIVLDPAIVPIDGATVTLKGVGLEAKTNVDGAFIFSDLEPGTYFLEAKKIGFSPAQTSVNVEAGIDTPPIVKVQLQPDLASIPFTEEIYMVGYLQCGAGLGAAGASTNPCAVADSVNVFNVAVQRPVDAAQSEMFWEGTNVFGDGLDIGHLRPGTFANYAGSDGPSPRILLVNGTKIAQENGDSYSEIVLRVFPGANQPVSVVLEQEFEIIHTNFYGFTPNEGWTFIENGKHPNPA